MNKSEWKQLLESWGSFVKESNLIREGASEKRKNDVIFFDYDPKHLDLLGINNTNIFEEIYAHIRDDDDYFPDDMIKDIEQEGTRSKYYYKHKDNPNINNAHLSSYGLLFVNNTDIKQDLFLNDVFDVIDSSGLSLAAKDFLKKVIMAHKERVLVFNPKGIQEHSIDKYDIHVIKDSQDYLSGANFLNKNPNYNNIGFSLPRAEFVGLDRSYSREGKSQIKKEVRDKKNDLISNYIKNKEEWDKVRDLFYEFSMLDQLSEEEENLYTHTLRLQKKKLGYEYFSDLDFQNVIEGIDGQYIDKEKTRELISQGIDVENYVKNLKKENFDKTYDRWFLYFSENKEEWEKIGREFLYQKVAGNKTDGESLSEDLWGGAIFEKQDYIDMIREIDGYYDPDYQLNPYLGRDSQTKLDRVSLLRAQIAHKQDQRNTQASDELDKKMDQRRLEREQRRARARDELDHLINFTFDK